MESSSSSPSSNSSSSLSRPRSKTDLHYHNHKPRRVVSAKSTSWCCSFNLPPKSPEALSKSTNGHTRSNPPKPQTSSAANSSSSEHLLSKTINNGNTSFPSSPQSSKSGLSLVGRIDPRRILSPGRVSPIDSDPTTAAAETLQFHALMSPDPLPADNVVGSRESEANLSMVGGSTQNENFNFDQAAGVDESHSAASDGVGQRGTDGEGRRTFDVRLNLKGKRGACLALDLSSEVLCQNSPVFADLISDYCRKSSNSASGASDMCGIEVPDVENLGVFRDTIELMFEDDITKQLLKVGASRAIDILEVSADIKFTRGIPSCLKYLEAVPWSEQDEEKLRRLFTRFEFQDETSKDIMSRLNLSHPVSSLQNLASQLVWSITTCTNPRARNELKSMVKSLISKCSVYEKDEQHIDIKKEELYSVSRSCLCSLTELFEESTVVVNSTTAEIDQASGKRDFNKPLLESISWQVDNINWLLEIMLDLQMAEDFVDTWADKKELIRMHGIASPMVRYELSRVSAALFIAMGARKLQCPSESRVGLFKAWFGPMLLDFGWLQLCRKGLSVRELEEAMGQVLLTLPLKQQYELFMEWFKQYSKHASNCPNLSRAFQIWWRRIFLRGSEMVSIESQ